MQGAIQIELPCVEPISVWLLPDKAIFIPRSGALILADVHIGKAATFRSLGVPVPHGTTDANLVRISQLIDQVQPSTIYFLGDLVHGPVALQPRIVEALSTWRAQHSSTRMVLIGGNHDAKAGGLPLSLCIETVSEPYLQDDLASAKLYFCHEPRAAANTGTGGPINAFFLAGHWHPVYRLAGRADSARLPCFWQQPQQLILPAFGEFTGGHPVSPTASDTLYLTDSVQVHSLIKGLSTNRGRG